jgi:rubredoxin
MGKPLHQFRAFYCTVCGHVYKEEAGEVERGLAPATGLPPGVEIPPGTLWKDIPDTFHCKHCGAPKSQFREGKYWYS